MTYVLKGDLTKEVTAREKRNVELSMQAAVEGAVLLKNDGALPIKGKKVALFGNGVRFTIKGGTGSGDTNVRHITTVEEGFNRLGFEVTSKKWLDDFDKFYNDSFAAYEKERDDELMKNFHPGMTVFEMIGKTHFSFPNATLITSDYTDSETDYCVYVISRQAGEGYDRKPVEGDWSLDEKELKNIALLSNAYKHLTVVINAGGFIDLSFLDTIKVDGLVFMGQGGLEGGYAIARLLAGEDNFSGKLSDSWVNNYYDYPNSASFSHNNGDVTHDDYVQGIYIGYRYHDTFDVAPRYPFGYGLSYTDFAIEYLGSKKTDGRIEISVKVKNTGDFAGKEVVEVYASSPREDAEYQSLVAFKKTKLLQKGEEENLTLSFAIKDLASYCEDVAEYRLEKGDYIVRLGNSSRNTTDVLTVAVNSVITTEKCVNIAVRETPIKEVEPPKKAALTRTSDVIEVETSDVNTVVHTYETPTVEASDRVKGLIEKMSPEELALLAVGDNVSGKRIVNVVGTSGSTTNALYEKYGIPNIVMSDGPAGLKVSNIVVKTGEETAGTTTIPAEYDNILFRQYVGKMLLKETDGEPHYFYATAWPVGIVLAQTWNEDIVEEVGDGVGQEMVDFGVTSWLAPGMNIHRNPLCGRSFEYYSEDPLLSGKIAAAMTRGVQSHKGAQVTMKHYTCNNQEENRVGSSSNVNERALREIYLKGFGIAIRESDPKSIMSSYNLINGVYSPNNYDLITKYLRNECGFTGYVMTDWGSCDYGRGSARLCPKAGNDLIMPGNEENRKDILEALECGELTLDELKAAATRVLVAIEDNVALPM